MLVAVWSAKGGVGVTATAALLGLSVAARGRDALLVDLRGDLPTVLGLDDDMAGVGLSDWGELADPSPEALKRIELPVRPGLQLVPWGGTALNDTVADALLAVLETDQRIVIVDCGSLDPVRSSSVARQLVAEAHHSLLVVRPCFVGLKAAQNSAARRSGVVLLRDPGRVLGRTDVELATGVPVIARMAVDPDLARSIDSGLARARLPRALLRTLGQVLDHAA